MRDRRSFLLAGVPMLLPLPPSPAMAEGVLRLGGTGGATALLVHLGKPFTRQTGIAVEVVRSLGSSGGIAAAADGVLDLAVAGRALSAAELGRGMVPGARLRTPYVFATSLPDPPRMAEDDIVRAFAAGRPVWPDGTPIRLVLRPRAESDNEVLVSLFPGMDTALERARQRTELTVAATDQDNADSGEKLRGSLIGTTYTQMIMERRNLRLVAVAGVAPSVEALEAGRYRPVKVFHFVHPRQPSAATARFMAFLCTEEGVRTLREAGCLPGAE